MVRERGYTIGLLLVILMLGGLSFVLSQLNTLAAVQPIDREVKNAELLRAAREALIAWASRHPQNPGSPAAWACAPFDPTNPCPDRPGALPCPDTDNDGWANEPCDNPNQRLGRLPWRTLNIEDLRDATGERLWYAVSQCFRHQRNYPSDAAACYLTAPPPSFELNPYKNGDLQLCAFGTACTGTDLLAGSLVALVIAPGAPLAAVGQDRTGGNINNPVHYLEGNNATVGDVNFDRGVASATFNDTVVALSDVELFQAVVPVVAERMILEVAPAIRAAYDPALTANPFTSWGGLPYAVPFTDPRALPNSSFADTNPWVPPPNGPTYEGLIPIHTNAALVNWSPSPGQARFITQPEPLGSSLVCSVNAGTGRLTCAITWNAALPSSITIGVTVTNVGRSFVRPFVPADVISVTPVTSSASFAQHGSFGTSSADAEVSLQIVVASNPTTIVLERPQFLAAVTNTALSFTQRTAWFMRNGWFRNVYYAVAAHSWATPGQCLATAGSCITLTYRDLPNGAVANSVPLNGVAVLMGRIFTPGNFSSPATYLEGVNEPTGPLPRINPLFETGRPFTMIGAQFNDRAVALHPKFP
jgi:hypothetical protein